MKLKAGNRKCVRCPANSLNCTNSDFQCLTGYVKNPILLTCEALRSRRRRRSAVSTWLISNPTAVAVMAVAILISFAILAIKFFSKLMQKAERRQREFNERQALIDHHHSHTFVETVEVPLQQHNQRPNRRHFR